MPAQRDPNTGRFIRATPPDVLEVIERRTAATPARRRRVPTGWIVAVFVVLVLAAVALTLLP